MDIFFSVVIPLYNKEKDIYNTIKSVLNQTYNKFEIIIVNDGSTDNGAAIVKSITDHRVKLFETQNKGVSSARNFGVNKASYDNIAFLDADDYWYPNHLESFRKLVKIYPEGKWYANAYEILNNRRLIIPMKNLILSNGINWMGHVDNIFKYCLEDCLVWTSAVCMKKDFFLNTGGFNTSLDVDQDTDLWIRAGISSGIYFSNIITARYNLLGANRISHTKVFNRNILDFDHYEAYCKGNIYLKKYLDLNRFAVALRFKMCNRISEFESYVSRLNLNNISKKQRFILKQNRRVLIIMVNIQSYLSTLGIRIRTS